MMRRIFLANVLALTLFLCGCPENTKNVLRVVVYSAVTQWHQETGIAVTQEATTEIQNALIADVQILHYAAQTPLRLRAGVAPQIPPTVSPTGSASPDNIPIPTIVMGPNFYENLEVAIESYLFFVRDKKLASTLYVIASASTDVPLPDPKIAEVTGADVRQYSLDDFIRRIKKLIFGDGTGYLQIMSTPDQAQITLDGDPSGGTVSKYLVSAGIHSVRVNKLEAHLDCSYSRLEVKPGEWSYFVCPFPLTPSVGKPK